MIFVVLHDEVQQHDLRRRHGVQLLVGASMLFQILFRIGIGLQNEAGGDELPLPFGHVLADVLPPVFEQLGDDPVGVLLAQRPLVGTAEHFPQRRERAVERGEFGAHRRGGVDERGGQVGERPEEVRRAGHLHPFLDVAEHDRPDGDGDEVLNQRVALADVPASEGEAGLTTGCGSRRRNGLRSVPADSGGRGFWPGPGSAGFLQRAGRSPAT